MITGHTRAYEQVGKTDIPVLLIWGREDRVVPFELNQEVREPIPHAEFNAVDSAAHAPHYEQPEVVSPLIVNFLNG